MASIHGRKSPGLVHLFSEVPDPSETLVCVCKHWLLSSRSNFYVPHFRCRVLHFWSCLSESSGGWVAILVKQSQVGVKLIGGTGAPGLSYCSNL